MAFDPIKLRGSEFAWLFDFIWAGQTYHLSTESVTTSFGDGGASLDYVAGLDFDGEVDDALDLFGKEPRAAQASVVLFLEDVLNVAKMVAEGHDLNSSRGRLWLWIKGTEDRLLLVDGDVRSPEYEEKSDPVSLTIEEAPYQDRGLLPGPGHRVNSKTWSNFDDRAEEDRYPVVFGKPGNAAGMAFGSPALLVEKTGAKSLLLIAGHEVKAGSVQISDEDGTVTSSVAHQYDALGRRVAVTDIHATAIGPATLGKSYFVSTWGDGGLDRAGVQVRGAGDVLEWLLERSTIRWDRGRLAAIQTYLNAYKVDGALVAGPEERVSPWAWITDHLLPILPISARTGPDGLYFALFRMDADVRDSVATIEEGRNADRISAVSYEGGDDVASEFQVAFAPRSQDGKMTQRAIISAEESAIEREGARGSLLCKLSLERYGHRVSEVSSSVIFDSATAFRVAHWQAAAYALPTRLVEYRASAELAFIEPGQVVSLNDSGLAIDERLAHVDSIRWNSSGTIDVSLRLFERPWTQHKKQ